MLRGVLEDDRDILKAFGARSLNVKDESLYFLFIFFCFIFSLVIISKIAYLYVQATKLVKLFRIKLGATIYQIVPFPESLLFSAICWLNFILCFYPQRMFSE